MKSGTEMEKKEKGRNERQKEREKRKTKEEREAEQQEVRERERKLITKNWVLKKTKERKTLNQTFTTYHYTYPPTTTGVALRSIPAPR